VVEGGLLAGDLRGLSGFNLVFDWLLLPNRRRTCSGDIGRFLLLLGVVLLAVLKLGFDPKYVPKNKKRQYLANNWHL
jgi:hypothetical protein